MGSSWISIFFVTVWTWEVIVALPTGAPSTACISMYPQHPGPNGPVSAQPSLVVPFRIDVAAVDNGRQYKINVVRNTNFPGQPTLLGFFLQVRDPVSDTSLGDFVQLPPYARIGDCGGNSTATHNNRQEKPIDQGLEFLWVPSNLPLNTKNLQVLGTFVQNMQTFWVKVPSQIFTVNVAAAPATTTNLQEAPAVVKVDSYISPISSSINNANIPVTSPNDRRPGFGNSALAGSGLATANDGTQQSSMTAQDPNAAHPHYRVVNSASSLPTFSFLFSTLFLSSMAVLL